MLISLYGNTFVTFGGLPFFWMDHLELDYEADIWWFRSTHDQLHSPTLSAPSRIYFSGQVPKISMDMSIKKHAYIPPMVPPAMSPITKDPGNERIRIRQISPENLSS